MEPMVLDLGYAIVKIHPGKLSDEERRKVLEEACKRFYVAVCKDDAKKGVKRQW